MVPLIVAQDGTFNEAEFREYLLAICKQHKEEQRALAFAFLVYDFADYTVNKIVEDKAYWSALDSISGQYLSIFYINTDDNYYRARHLEIYREEKAAQDRAAAQGYMSYMRPLYLRATPLQKSIAFLKKEFGLDGTLRTPFILFFQVDDDSVIDWFLIDLNQERLDDAFLEVRRHIMAAVESISRVEKENFNNHQAIFDLIKTGLDAGKFQHFVKSKVVSKLGFGSIISLIRLFAGG